MGDARRCCLTQRQHPTTPHTESLPKPLIRPRASACGIRTVAAGEALLAPSLTKRLIEEYLRQPPPVEGVPDQLATLTEREREVLVLMARGHTNDEIAGDLVVARATVKTHVNRVLAKLGVATRVQAMVRAYECGLVRPGGTVAERTADGGRR